MITLKQLFELRDRQFDELTGQIHDKMTLTTRAVLKYFLEQGRAITHLKWDDISYIPQDDVVVLLGNLTEQPIESDEPIKSIIHICLPQPVVAEGTFEEIMACLQRDRIDEDTLDLDTWLEDVKQSIADEFTEEEQYQSSSGFDLDSLSEDQKQLLYLLPETKSRN